MSCLYETNRNGWQPLAWRKRKINAGEWLVEARQRLAQKSEAPLREAQVLLGYVLSRNQSWLLAHPDFPLTDEQVEQAEQLLKRLAGGEPLPYLLGRQEFFGLEFTVNRAVLIPRPETELLVEEALSWLQAHPGRRSAADVGTGSGCIAVTLAYHTPDLSVTAIDVSPLALEVAAINIRNYGVENRVHLVRADLLNGLTGHFDLICANLPYIPTGKLPTLEVTQWEPQLALDGGQEGLGVIERLLQQLPEKLAPGGLALLEIEAGQGESASELARRYFLDTDICIQKDLAGLPRVLRLSTDR